MILGFAHLAINVDDTEQAMTEWSGRGYQLVAVHYAASNHPSKSQFLNCYQPKHDLLLLKGENLWPLELTHHGDTQGANQQITWAASHIILTVSEGTLDALRRLLLEGLGFVAKDDGELYLHSRLPGWSCKLKLNIGVTAPILLDATGPTCLAFYCNRIEEESQRLLMLGAESATDIFEMALNGRAMQIIMMRVPGGPLIELINPISRTA